MSPLLQDRRLYVLPDVAGYTLWFPTAPADAPPAVLAWGIVLAWTSAFLVPAVVVARTRDT